MRIRSAAIVLSIGVLLAADSCRQGRPAAGSRAIDSKPLLIELGSRDVAEVTTGRVGTGVAIRGSLDPAQRVQVKAPLPGRLSRVFVDRASSVRSGQLLALIDARTLQAQSTGAAAALASAERDYAAADMLQQRGAIPRSDFVRARAALEAARAQATGASQGLADARIVAPLSGIVTESFVSGNETVMPGQPLFTIVNTSELNLVAKISPAAVRAVRVGQPVSLSVNALQGTVVEGRVSRIEAVADAGTRLVSVFVRVPNPTGSLVAGIYAEGVIMTASEGAAAHPIIPLDAVRDENGKSVVYAIVGDRLQRSVVTLGTRDEGRGIVEVLSGIEAASKVVIQPTAALQDGQRVKINETDKEQS